MSDPDDLAEWWGSSEQAQQALLQHQPSFNGLPAQIEHMRGRGCKCTRSHAYRTCPRFSEHFWFWLEGADKNDFCTCPPTDENLLMLECPNIIQHIQVCSYLLLYGRIVLTIINPRMSSIGIPHCRTLPRPLANVHAQRCGNIFPLVVVFTDSTWIVPGRARRGRTRKIP